MSAVFQGPIVRCLLSAAVIFGVAACDQSERETGSPALETAPVVVEPRDQEAFASDDQPEPIAATADVPELATAFQLPTPLEVPPARVLKESGLTFVETASVRVVTDLSKPEVAPLVKHIDRVWPALEDAFGPVRSDVPVAATPLTAFIVRDIDCFANAGLLGRNLPTNIHGKHSGWQFWMRWPESAYYQRHLFAHESAHCYSLITQPNLPSGWMESIAEWFATHSDDGDRTIYGVIPNESSRVAGWGRIELLRQEVEAGRVYTAEQVAMLPGDFFQGVPTAYAWAWALSSLLDHTDHEVFRRLIARTTQGRCKTAEIRELCRTLDESGLWAWWIESVDYGIDLAEALPRISSGDPVVEANAGWQSFGLIAPAGQRLEIRASGEAVLAELARRWTTGPEGIRADFSSGVPIGTLLARVRVGGHWSPVVTIGKQATVSFPSEGELFFRINDHWNSLEENSGEYRVTVQPVD